MSNQCDEKIVFPDEFSENNTIFTCKKPSGHEGLHMEQGSLNGKDYKIEWS